MNETTRDSLISTVAAAGPEVSMAAAALVQGAYSDGRHHSPVQMLPKRWGKDWARWAGVTERTAQRWLKAERPAPAWAVFLAVENLDVVDKGAVALQLLSMLARAYADSGAGGNQDRQVRLIEGGEGG